MSADSDITLTNANWIADLDAGREKTVRLLRERLRRGLGAALCTRYDVSEADLDDFTQDSVVRVMERLDQFRGDSRFTTWAMAVAMRVAFTALRRRRGAVSIDALPRSVEPTASGGRTPVDSGARRELFSAMRAAMESELTDRQRQVLLMELDGVPQVSVAERLGATAGAIYKTSHDARKKLKAALERIGYDADSVKELLAASS